MKKIVPGSIVAFNTLPDPVWFDVLSIDGFSIIVREHNTTYAPQTSDKSLVKQVK